MSPILDYIWRAKVPENHVFYGIFCSSAFSVLGAFEKALVELATPRLDPRGGGRGRGKPLPRALGTGRSEKRSPLSHRRPEGWWDYCCIIV